MKRSIDIRRSKYAREREAMSASMPNLPSPKPTGGQVVARGRVSEVSPELRRALSLRFTKAFQGEATDIIDLIDDSIYSMERDSNSGVSHRAALLATYAPLWLPNGTQRCSKY